MNRSDRLLITKDTNASQWDVLTAKRELLASFNTRYEARRYRDQLRQQSKTPDGPEPPTKEAA
jgi:hypothetical protein